MKWEELKVYRRLSKEELKPAFKDFIRIISENLKFYQFSLHGRKLIRLSNDLLQVIHIDTRGSWLGINEYYETEIALVAISDKLPFTSGAELTGSKGIEEISKGIRNNRRITKEYPLLADFLTRKIIENILPYFNKYDVSKKVLNDSPSFEIGHRIQRNDDLILFCELQNRTNVYAEKILHDTISFASALHPDRSQLPEYIKEFEFYKQALSTNDWIAIEERLEANKNLVLKKLKIKPPVN